MKMKKKTKKKVKKIKSNKKNEDYNWNKKTIWGQLLILVGSTWLSRKEEKKERGKKFNISKTTMTHRTLAAL
jgi:hypothetical protein